MQGRDRLGSPANRGAGDETDEMMGLPRKTAIGLLAATLAALGAVLFVSAVRPDRRTGPPAPDPFPGAARRWASIPPGKPPPFQPGEKLVYEFGWSGVPCAQCSVSLTEQDVQDTTCLVLEYELHTSKAIDWAWRFRTQGSSCLDPETGRILWTSANFSAF